MTRQEQFQENLKHLKTAQPGLADRLRQASSLYDSLIPTKSGSHTLRLEAEDGSSRYLHSRYQPEKVAQKFIDSQKFESLTIYIMFGHGLGYELECLARKMTPGMCVIVFEPSLSVFRTWLEMADRSALLSNIGIRFVVASEADDVYGFLRNDLGRMFAGDIQLLHISEAGSIYTEYIESLRKAVQEAVKVGAFMMKTSFTLARANLKNRMENIPAYVSNKGVEFYKDRFKGKPGVCVLAGPSLGKNIDLLREVKGYAPIISVSTTLKLLLARGIEPDFSAVLDFQKISRNFFNDIDPRYQIPLVCDPKGNSESIDGYTGPKIFFYDSFIADSFEDPSKFTRGQMESGGTVAHLAFGFARYMGCDPIITIGLDLAYSDGLTHIPGTLYFYWWRSEMNRFNHYEMAEWKFVRREIEKLVPLEDWQGNKIYTTEHYMSYGKEFERMFSDTPQRVIDATEGGTVLAGAELMTLRQAIDTCMQEKLDDELFVKPRMSPEEQRELLELARAQLECRKLEAKDVRSHAQEALYALKNIRNRLHNNKPVNHMINQVQKLNPVLNRYPILMKTLETLMVSDEYHRQIADARIEAEQLQDRERSQAQLDRDRDYLDAMRNAIKELVQTYDRSIARINIELEAL
ncbi:motility associated factor glycosyltransferase family protein [Planctomycetota bacterium]